MTDEKLFEMAGLIYAAHVQSGQQSNGRILLEQTADLFPVLYDTIKKAWSERNLAQDLMDLAPGGPASGNVN